MVHNNWIYTNQQLEDASVVQWDAVSIGKYLPTFRSLSALLDHEDGIRAVI